MSLKIVLQSGFERGKLNLHISTKLMMMIGQSYRSITSTLKSPTNVKDERKHVRAYGQRDGQIHGRMDGEMRSMADGPINECTNGRRR